MGKSIRWTLLTWYALILVAVLGAFGAVLYTMLLRSMLQEVDAEVRAHAQAMAASIEAETEDRFELEHSDAYVKYFQQEGEDAPYYVIWDGKGEVIDSSDPAIVIERPTGPAVRTRNDRREFIVPGPSGTLLMVGRGMHDAHHRLREFLWMVCATGAGILAVALAGGWFLAGRALAPIERISATAAAMSAENLSHRIDVGRTETELGRLATTLNEAFDRLEASFERQTRFTADASHELRTPLSIVLAQAELALKKDRSAAEYRETLETCLKAGRRMRAVVEGLLTLARADAGEANLAREEVDLGKVVEETAALLRPMAEEKRVALATELAEVRVLGDRDRLREAVANLIANAIRYNRDNGRVDIALRGDADSAILTVADTGIGIPAADQGNLFERFYRVDKARSREQGGSGLGLAITRWIVEAHGGTIAFTSRENEGTTFTVRMARKHA